MELGIYHLNLIRQWFNALQDINPRYLDREDYKLAIKIFECSGHSTKPLIEKLTELN